jgi:hypothetical protein
VNRLPIFAQWLQLIITACIAFFAAYIAYRQWQTAHQRVVLDLFERRMKVYDDARAVISEIMRDGTANHQIFFRYCQATDRLGLLFGDEVVAYSDVTRDRINRFIMHETMVRAYHQGDPIKDHHIHIDKAAQRLSELSGFYDEFSSLVMPYVRMTQKQSKWPWRKDRKRRSQIDVAAK